MLKVAIGHSEDPDNQAAVDDILKQCKESLNNLQPKAGILFASVSYDFQFLLDSIKKVYPNIELTGCSSFGEISSKLGVCENSVALMLFATDKADVYAGLAENIPNDPYRSLQNAAEKALSNVDNQKPTLCVLLPDGLKTNISDAIRGLSEYFGKNNFQIGGGTASDDFTFTKVHLFYKNKVASDAASFLIFTEPVKSSIAVDHEMSPIGKKHHVTKSKGNVVYLVDDKPVLDLYKSYLGEPGPNFFYGEYPLAIYPDDNSKKFLIRSPFMYDEKDGSMTFAGDVPENSIVRISKTNPKEETLRAASRCAKKALQSFPGTKVDCALVFSCVSRKEILGTETQKEFDLIKKELPDETPIFGFYTFGEIGKEETKDPSHFYNHTIVMVLIGE